jgi:hypothetical protein
MFTSDAENSTKGTSMTVDVEKDFDEARGGHVETESEDEDPEATRRYWEVKRKKEGVHKVRF